MWKKIKTYFNSLLKIFKDIIGGKFLTKRFFISLIPLLFLIAFLSILLIDNGYYCDTQTLEIKKTNDSIRIAIFEQTSVDAELQQMSIQSEIKKMISEKNIPLEKPLKSPVYIGNEQ